MTVVIGANGSGKSNFIGAFSLLNAIGEGRLKEYVIKAGGADRILHFGSKVTEELHIHISFEDDVDQYSIRLAPNGGDELIPRSEAVHSRNKPSHGQPYVKDMANRGKEAGISLQDSPGVKAYIKQRLNSWRVYHFHDTSKRSPMRRASDVHDNRYLRPDGSNLAAFLYLLKRNHEDSYRIITSTIRQVAPFFDSFRLEPQRLNPQKIRLEWHHAGTDSYFDMSSLSGGTLRFMALATLFLQPAHCRPSLILVDEPELGLHPSAITMLAAMMNAASTEVQVIVSTQSPLLLDHFDPKDVLVADRIDGATRLSRLETSRLDSWLEDYSLGQLWEKNEFGGRPAAEQLTVPSIGSC